MTATQVNTTYTQSPFFNAAFYLKLYADLRNAFGENLERATQHWLDYGIQEGRIGSSEFDARYYLAAHPDVAKVQGANNYKGAIDHYLQCGRNDRRKCTDHWHGRVGELTCFFYIREKTKNEYVSINSHGNILRWGYTGNEYQQWLLVPAGAPGEVRIITRQNGENMAVGSDGNILRWESFADGGQIFKIVNADAEGWFNLQEPTQNEYADVAWDHGNIARWSWNGKDNQRFRLEPVDMVPKGAPTKPTHQPFHVPEPPKLRSLVDIPQTPTQRYLVGEDVLPAVLVNDDRFSSKLEQMKACPYYYLKREQYWDSSPNRGGLFTFSGREGFSRTIFVAQGMSRTHVKHFEKTFGVSVEIGVSAGYGPVSAELKTQFSYEEKQSETTTTRTTEYRSEETKLEYQVQNEEFKVVTWSLVDAYTLCDGSRQSVRTWEVVHSDRIRDCFPDAQKKQ